VSHLKPFFDRKSRWLGSCAINRVVRCPVPCGDSLPSPQ